MHPPHSAVFCNKGKALRARENTSHERPTFEQATLGAHKPKGQSTHGTHDHVPKHKKVSAHRSTRTAHRDTARPVFQPNKGTRSDTRASAYSHTLVSHTLVCPTPTPCPTQHVLDRTNYDAVLLHTPQRNPTPGQQRPLCHLVRQASRHPPPLTCHTLTCRNAPLFEHTHMRIP